MEEIMKHDEIFSETLKQQFEDIGTKLYNFKYSFDLFVNCLEDEADVPLKLQCLALVLDNYFNMIKKEYNKLEEDLGVLL